MKRAVWLVAVAILSGCDQPTAPAKPCPPGFIPLAGWHLVCRMPSQ